MFLLRTTYSDCTSLTLYNILWLYISDTVQQLYTLVSAWEAESFWQHNTTLLAWQTLANSQSECWQCWQDGDAPLSLNTTDSTAGTWRHFRDKYLCVQEQQQWEWEQCWSRVTGVDSSDNDKQSSIYWVEVDIFLVWSVELVAVKLWIIFVKVSQTLSQETVFLLLNIFYSENTDKTS